MTAIMTADMIRYAHWLEMVETDQARRQDLLVVPPGVPAWQVAERYLRWGI